MRDDDIIARAFQGNDKSIKHLEREQKELSVREELRDFHENNPLWKLWVMAKMYNVPSSSKVRRFENDPQYVMYDIEQYDEISRAMKMADAYGLLKSPAQNPAIVAIQPVLSKPPHYYYIRKDVLRFRKKKVSKAKPKRKVIKRKITKRKSK